MLIMGIIIIELKCIRKKKMKKLIVRFLALLVLVNVASAETSRRQKYFPDGTVDFEEYCSDFLDAFDPSSIMSMEKGCNELRFSCIESMATSYVIKVSWTKHSRKMVLIAENSPMRKIEFPIEKSALDKLQKMLSDCDFYNQESSAYVPGRRDGVIYLLEVNIDGKYKAVSIWGPPHEKYMSGIKEFLVKQIGGMGVIQSNTRPSWRVVEWIEE